MSENNSLFTPPAGAPLPTSIPAARESNPGHVREDHSPTDPNFRWQGVSTDIRNRPTPNQLDEIRARAARVETAVQPDLSEKTVAMQAYNLGMPVELIRRLVAAETAIFLLQAEIYGLEQHLNMLEKNNKS